MPPRSGVFFLHPGSLSVWLGWRVLLIRVARQQRLFGCSCKQQQGSPTPADLPSSDAARSGQAWRKRIRRTCQSPAAAKRGAAQTAWSRAVRRPASPSRQQAQQGQLAQHAAAPTWSLSSRRSRDSRRSQRGRLLNPRAGARAVPAAVRALPAACPWAVPAAAAQEPAAAQAWACQQAVAARCMWCAAAPALCWTAAWRTVPAAASPSASAPSLGWRCETWQAAVWGTCAMLDRCTAWLHRPE